LSVLVNEFLHGLGQLLSLIGFVPGGATQADTTLFWLRAGYTLLPMLFVIVAGWFLKRVWLPREQAASDHAMTPAAV
jgi:Na+/melibiose symporter-like transporter